MGVYHFKQMEESEAWRRAINDPHYEMICNDYLDYKQYLMRVNWQFWFTGTTRKNASRYAFHNHLQKTFFKKLRKKANAIPGFYYVVASGYPKGAKIKRTHCHALICLRPRKGQTINGISPTMVKNSWGMGISRADGVTDVEAVSGYMASHVFPSQAVEYAYDYRGAEVIAEHGRYFGDGLDGWLVDADTPDTPPHLRINSHHPHERGPDHA